MNPVTFTEADHIYRDGSGKALPSVTRIIRDVFQTGSFGYSDDARQRGEAVHRACQLISEGRFSPERAHPTIQGFAHGWSRYIAECQFKSQWWEKPLASSWGFAGKADTFGQFAVGDFVVIDCKSGSRPPWVGLQLAAYKILIKENFGLAHTIKARAVQLQADGKYKVHSGVNIPGNGFVPFDDQRWTDWFVSALNVYRSGLMKTTEEAA